MQQLSATCPHCSFVLQFYDASLYGRRGKCPKCHNKFILEKRDADDRDMGDLFGEAAADTRETGTASLPASRENGSGQSTAPPVAAQVPAASPPAAGEESGTAWELDLNRGLGTRPAPAPRWVFPNAFALKTIAAIGTGAMLGVGAALLLTAGDSIGGLSLASALGGAIGAACLVRRRDPRSP